MTSVSSRPPTLEGPLRDMSTHFSDSPAQHCPRVQPGTPGTLSRGRSHQRSRALHGRSHLGSSSTPSAWIGRVAGCGIDRCTRLAHARRRRQLRTDGLGDGGPGRVEGEPKASSRPGLRIANAVCSSRRGLPARLLSVLKGEGDAMDSVLTGSRLGRCSPGGRTVAAPFSPLASSGCVRF